MILSEAKSTYYELTGKASDVNRQLGFAGIAIVWIFCSVKNGMLNIPEKLILPTLLIVISLGFDLLQYISGSIVWGWFHRYNERIGISENAEVFASKYLNYPQNGFFVLKIFSMLLAYLFLMLFLLSSMYIL